jgi:DNA ligase 1
VRGTCIRKLDGLHKQGRSTVREMGLLRIKRFVESEALVMSIEEGETNLNEAQINELGKMFRSSHKENKVPDGMVGSLICKALQDVKDAHSGRLLIEEGQEIKVSPGNMDHNNRRRYFNNQGEIIGKVIKYKFFPKGIKDKPRFPTFQTFRIESDL